MADPCDKATAVAVNDATAVLDFVACMLVVKLINPIISSSFLELVLLSPLAHLAPKASTPCSRQRVTNGPQFRAACEMGHVLSPLQ